MVPRKIFRVLLYGILSFYSVFFYGIIQEADAQEIDKPKITGNELLIYKLQPEQKDGLGYRMIYWVEAPLEVFWKFKIDFNNDFVVSNKDIKLHRFVRLSGNMVITENEYASKPGKIFRWQTTVLSERHRLEFKLLNPKESGQKFHYGYIQLEAVGERTKVTQVAYFDFWGVFWWVNYPFYGGMKYYLKRTAHWEQQTIRELKEKY
jgi:hypothetical protein